MAIKKRQNNMIIVWAFLSVLVFIVLSIFSSFFIYAKIIEIEDSKADFQELLENYNYVKESWIKYKDYQKLIKTSGYNSSALKDALSSEYTKELLTKVDSIFYNENFTNELFENYDKFLIAKKIEVDKSWLKDDFMIQENQISKILPVYTEESDFYTETSLTNFKFINYVESLLKEYSLKTNSPIWIGDIEPIDKIIKDLDIIKNIEPNLFYIPLTLDIWGRKDKVIKFLEESYEMWSIGFKDWEIIINNTKQVLEINSLEMSEYVDSWVIHNKKYDNLIDLIKNEQAAERIDLSIELRFYIAWISSLKMKEEVLKIIWDSLNNSTNSRIKELEEKQEESDKELTFQEEILLKELIERRDIINNYKTILAKDSAELSDEDLKKIKEYTNKMWYYEKLKILIETLIAKASKEGKITIKDDLLILNKTLLSLSKDIKELHIKYNEGEELEDILNKVQAYRMIFISIESKVQRLANNLNLK